MRLAIQREDGAFDASADLTYTLDVMGSGEFPISLTFSSDWWFDPNAKEPTQLPIKLARVSLGPVEAQALAVALLLVASDQSDGPDWPRETLSFDLTGPMYHMVSAQLPPRYFSAIAEARGAVRRVMDSQSGLRNLRLELAPPAQVVKNSICELCTVGCSFGAPRQAARWPTHHQLTADWQARQTWAVVFTGAVIIWYTWETYQLRRVNQRQIELQIRPFVVLSRQAGKFHVTNIGNGPALNVRVDQVSIMTSADAFIRFPESIPVLKPTQTEAVPAESFIAGRSQGGFLDAHLDPQHANQAFEITVRYQDTDFAKHALTMRTQPGRFTIVSFEERAA